MYLVLVTAFIAVCGADKLDRTYLPPASATTAGGGPGSLQTPFRTFNQGLGGLPTGSYSNDFEGVVVDVAAPGTRASGADETGLGGPRIAYGSTDSKVGEAAFTADTAFPRVGVHSGLNTPGAFGAQKQVESRPERVQSYRDRVSNIVRYESDVRPDSFNYAFETDNGIVAEENGIEVNGVKAQGGYSYTGDDGQVYSVTYTADEEGYRPKGDHLPTPPPIPADILKSLEKNAQDEAAGVIDDGSYDAQKYNTGEDYTKSDNVNGQYNGGPTAQVGNRPQSDAVASGSFISQSNQGYVRPNSNQFGSTFDSSKGVPMDGNIAVGSNGNRPTQNSQIGFGIATNNEYLPPSNVFNQNRRPDFNNRPSSIQSDPQTASSFDVNSSIEKNQNKEIPSFVPLGQQELQKDKPKRPQANTPIFGKPTLIDSSLSIKDPFARVPSGNKFTENKQPSQKPQSIGGSFQVVSGNVYSSKNEYLPPRRQNNRPNQYNGNQNLQGTTGIQSNQKFPGSQFLGPNSPTVNAFASISRPSSGYQQSQQYSTPAPQYTGNGFSSQINQSPGSRPQESLSSGFQSAATFNKSPVSQPLTFQAPQFPTLQPQTELTTPLESNSDQNNAPAPTPVIDGPDSPSPTSFFNLPPFGSKPINGILGQHSFNSIKLQQISPASGSTVTDQSFTSTFQNTAKPGRPEGNFGPQSQFASNFQNTAKPVTPEGNFLSQSQFTSKFQNTAKPGTPEGNFGPQSQFTSNFQNTAKPVTPEGNFLSQSQFTSKFQNTAKPGTPEGNFPSQSQFTSNLQNTAKPGTLAGNLGPQSQFTNKLPVNIPSSFSTERPNFGQYNQQQSSDDSYYYNTPSKPFNIPTPRPQGAIFSSSSFDQSFKVPQTPFNTVPQLPNTPQSFFTPQNNKLIDSTKYAKPSSLGPISPTLPTKEDEQNVNTIQSQDNKVTQATTSSFFSLKPTASVDFERNQFGQFASRPFQQINNINKNTQSLNQPGSPLAQATASVQSVTPGPASYKPLIDNIKPTTNQDLSSQSQQTQTYGGEVYEYKKPPQTLPAPQNSVTSGQFGQTSQFGSTVTTPQFGQYQSSGIFTPGSQFSSQFTQQSSTIGQRPQNSQVSQDKPSFNPNSQTQSQLNPGQFVSQPLNSNQNSQPIQGASKFPPAYNNQAPPCCKQIGFVSQSSQAEEQDKTPQLGDTYRPNQDVSQQETGPGNKPAQAVSSFAGVGENFGGPRKPPSFDQTGYHY